MTARDYTWLPADFHQNFLQSLDFISFLNLSHKALIFLPELPLGQEVSNRQPSSTIINWSLSGFPPQSPVIGLGSFSPAAWLFKTHQLLYRARMFSLVSRFSFSVSQGVGRFFTKLHSYPYVWRSLRLRGKAIVISWSRGLQITGCTWFNYVSSIITQPTRDLPTLSFYPKILHVSNSSISSPLWALFCIISLSLQPHLLHTNLAIN